MKIFFLSILYSILFVNCSQSKSSKKTNESNNTSILNTTIDGDSTIAKYFKISLSKPFYFDPVEKIPYKSFLIRDVGQVVMFYIPKIESDKIFFNDFENKNSLSIIHDDENDAFYYNENTKKKINLLLKKVSFNESSYKLVLKLIPLKNIDIETESNYSVNYPHELSVYKLESNNWVKVKEIIIQNISVESEYKNKDSLLLLCGLKQNIDSRNAFENWKGKYSFEQKILDGYGRNSKIIAKLNLIKTDSSIFEFYLADESNKIYAINHNHFSLLVQLVWANNSDSASFVLKKIISGKLPNAQSPIFTIYKYDNSVYTIKSFYTTPPHNSIEELRIIKGKVE